jgi:hypothetical protein
MLYESYRGFQISTSYFICVTWQSKLKKEALDLETLMLFNVLFVPHSSPNV